MSEVYSLNSVGESTLLCVTPVVIAACFDLVLYSVCCLLIMSHSLLWRHIVLLTVGVYSSNLGVLYTIGISDLKKV